MNRLTNREMGDAEASTPRGNDNPGVAILDRSRSQLRLPIDIVPEAMLIAHAQSIPDVDPSSLSEPPADRTIDSLQAGGIMAGENLDPIAYELLNVVNQASLMVAADLFYGDDSAMSTVWATPRRAVVSGSIDPNYIEFRSVPVTQLPQVLAELIVLRSPRFIGDEPMIISSQALNKAKKAGVDRDKAVTLLTDDGLKPDLAVLAVDLHRPDVRRWQITSTWSTDDGSESTELRGLDAGPSGQWLVGTTEVGEGATQLLFTPQGHGDIMSAFRGVLPKNWLGTPLNPPTDLGL